MACESSIYLVLAGGPTASVPVLGTSGPRSVGDRESDGIPSRADGPSGMSRLVAVWRIRLRRRSPFRRRSLWPSFLTFRSEVPVRLRPAAAQIVRLTVAAVVAYLVANAVSPGIVDLT